MRPLLAQRTRLSHSISISARAITTTARCLLPQSRAKLPSSPARTRFAPSPTGSLHLGSLRTALYNYLLARATNGSFLLRLEDTDARRTVPGAEAALYADLQWAGLHWDEGPVVGGLHGPYRQSERTHIYQKYATDLVQSGHGYHCFCSSERLDDLARRRRALGMPTDYDRLCAHLSPSEVSSRLDAGESSVVRLRAPSAYPPFTDLVYGRIGRDGGGFNAGITTKHGEIAYEDPVLLKSDGHPTYHLANVVDDHLMGITHVVRATEWLPSTPKHLALYAALGWEPPVFAHVGLLVDSAGRKLSKRHMDTGVGAWRERGVLSASLLNFAALLGWSHARRGDVLDLHDMLAAFTLQFTKGNATVDEGKLWFLQRAHVARLVERTPSDPTPPDSLADLLARLTAALHAAFPTAAAAVSPATLRALLRADARNYTTPAAFIQRNVCFFRPTAAPPRLPDWLAADAAAARTLAALAADTLRCADAWRHDALEAAMKDATARHAREVGGEGEEEAATAQRQKAWYKQLCRYLRWALLEGHDGPGLGWTMEILGAEVARRRVDAAGRAVEDGG